MSYLFRAPFPLFPHAAVRHNTVYGCTRCTGDKAGVWGNGKRRRRWPAPRYTLYIIYKKRKAPPSGGGRRAPDFENNYITSLLFVCVSPLASLLSRMRTALVPCIAWACAARCAVPLRCPALSREARHVHTRRAANTEPNTLRAVTRSSLIVRAVRANTAIGFTLLCISQVRNPCARPRCALPNPSHLLPSSPIVMQLAVRHAACCCVAHLRFTLALATSLTPAQPAERQGAAAAGAAAPSRTSSSQQGWCPRVPWSSPPYRT